MFRIVTHLYKAPDPPERGERITMVCGKEVKVHRVNGRARFVCGACVKVIMEEHRVLLKIMDMTTERH